MRDFWPLIPVLFLVQAGEEPKNLWKDKVPAAVQRAEREQTSKGYSEALDTTWRADDWQSGLKLARNVLEQLEKHPDLRGRVVRALWRAGELGDAERLAAEIPPQTTEPVAITTLLEVEASRMNLDRVRALADRLESLPPASAVDYLYLLNARMLLNRFDGAVEFLRKAQKLTDPRNGYPEIYVAEQLGGLPEFLEKVGPDPLNRIASYGEAPMPPSYIGLPVVDALINGRGPYRLIVDTGGSTTLSLDDAVAEDLGVKSVADAVIRGVSGTESSGQAIVDDLQIGSIRCQRVVTRIFGVRKAVLNAADGILGTGIFADGRMTLNLFDGRLRVDPSSDRPGPGETVDVRLVRDAKIMALVTLEGARVLGLFDSGADAVALAPSRLRRLFPDRQVKTLPNLSMALGVGSGETPEVSMNAGVKLAIGSRTYENYSGLGLDVLDVTLGPVLGVQADVLLGMPVFRDMKKFTFDFPRCKLWIEWLK
jgi:predicted aspartyl protease